MLDEQAFQRAADDALEGARRALLPAADEHGFEVDYNAGVLNVEFEEPTRAKFVVSPNTPVRQIWVSALAKSFKLEWSEAGRTFVLAETGETLQQLLARVTGQQLGVSLTL
jgi:CyaY protein